MISEEVRFELTKRFHVYTLSKRAPSATRTLLHEIGATILNANLTYKLFDLKRYKRRAIIFIYEKGHFSVFCPPICLF